jgi:SAM-dependent methyltransferase
MQSKIKRRLKYLLKTLRRQTPSRNQDEPGAADLPMPPFVPGETDYEQWVRAGIQHFRQWYQPVDFGDGLVAHVTQGPDWQPVPELDKERGLAKWDFIVRRHLPDLTGKRVLDLGCNNGVFSLELARMGAAEVVGIDRDSSFRQKTNRGLPVQDVVAQANFVKWALEIKNDCKYPVRYIGHDITRLAELNLGRFDVILALCVVYHVLDEAPAVVRQLAQMTDHLVLQSNITHAGEVAKWADPFLNARWLVEAGFTHVEIDAPAGYACPMIIGRR